MNAPTIIILVLIIAMVAAVIFKMIKDKKQGKSSCGCGCENCALHDSCHHK